MDDVSQVFGKLTVSRIAILKKDQIITGFKSPVESSFEFVLKSMLSFRLCNRFCKAVTIHMKNINALGIQNSNLVLNPSIPQLYEIALLKEPPVDPFTRQTYVASHGGLCAYSGLKTGREPQNGRLVKDATTEKDVNWASKTNIPLKTESFRVLEKFAVSFLNHNRRCIVVDGYAGWNPQHRMKIRVFCTRSYHALFMRNMLIQPTAQELVEDFAKGVDIHIFNAGEMSVSKNIEGLTASTVCSLNLAEKKMVILGTQFAGEMKKSIFKIMHYFFPKKGILTLHASAAQSSTGYTIMCGLSGTGKTALALRKEFKIIGDDELCWGPDGIFGIEGGCYAKLINLKYEDEPEIYDAMKFGSILENVMFYPDTRDVNYNDATLTQNTRGSFPLNFLPNAKIPAVGGHPNNIIFLTCDTKGVFPPICMLDNEQAAFQFLSGYTAKIGGTDLTSKSPESTFSACFGEIFLPLDPVIYAKMFYEKIKQHKAKIWLINTGWVGGKYGVGRRISLKETDDVIAAIHTGQLDNVQTRNMEFFNVKVPKHCPGIQDDLLQPEKGWSSRVEYHEALSSLAIEFINNYNKKYKGRMGDYSAAIEAAMPVI